MQFGIVEKRPVFEDYWARLAQRPAHLRATQIDDAAMPKAAG
jgi:glutathione S-transferase